MLYASKMSLETSKGARGHAFLTTRGYMLMLDVYKPLASSYMVFFCVCSSCNSSANSFFLFLGPFFSHLFTTFDTICHDKP